MYFLPFLYLNSALGGREEAVHQMYTRGYSVIGGTSFFTIAPPLIFTEVKKCEILP